MVQVVCIRDIPFRADFFTSVIWIKLRVILPSV